MLVRLCLFGTCLHNFDTKLCRDVDEDPDLLAQFERLLWDQGEPFIFRCKYCFFALRRSRPQGFDLAGFVGVISFRNHIETEHGRTFDPAFIQMLNLPEPLLTPPLLTRRPKKRTPTSQVSKYSIQSFLERSLRRRKYHRLTTDQLRILEITFDF